jgi:hypothetical protein
MNFAIVFNLFTANFSIMCGLKLIKLGSNRTMLILKAFDFYNITYELNALV